MGETVVRQAVEYKSPAVRRVAWAAWIGMAIVIGLILYFDDLNGRERSVVPNYRAAVVNWIAGNPLYNMGGSGFVYAPQCALVFVPWAMLPKPYGEIVWSWTILAVLAVGVFRLTRMVSHDDRWFLISTVVTAAISAGCARNGQATLIITGLMLLATVELKAEHWWRATVLLALAFAFKPVSFVMILLVAVIYRPMMWRLAVATLFVGIAPFLVARPEYALTQCVAFYENSHIAFKDGETGYWAHIYGMLKVFGLDLPSPIQQTGRVVFAVGTLAACWLAARKLPQDRGLFFLFAFSNCYLMLFNSRTEGSTYAMVAPIYGILLAESLLLRRNIALTIGFTLAALATTLNFDLAKLITPPPREIWMGPFVCVVVSVYLAWRLAKEMRTADNEMTIQTS
jgi:alpha-1,2-mannosyltransferase